MCPRGGVLLADGSVLWIIDDIRDATPVGAVTGRLYLPAGYVKANGATVKRADYPRLVAMADNYSLWTDASASNIGLFGKGDGSTTMVLPDWTGRMTQFAATAGGTVAAGLPELYGVLSDRCDTTGIPGGVVNTSGVFTSAGWGNVRTEGSVVMQSSYGAIFSAARYNSIYGNSSTVQPPAINVLAVIRY